MTEKETAAVLSSLYELICAIFLLSLFLNNTSGLQSPSSALLIGHQSSQSWGLNFDVYHINSKSLAKARGGWQRGTKKALDPIMIVVKWYWYLSLLVSSHPAGSETVKSQPASGHPGEDETFSRLTLKNDWARSLFAHGFGANSSACCGRCEAFQQLPLGKMKKRRKG